MVPIYTGISKIYRGMKSETLFPSAISLNLDTVAKSCFNLSFLLLTLAREAKIRSCLSTTWLNYMFKYETSFNTKAISRTSFCVHKLLDPDRCASHTPRFVGIHLILSNSTNITHCDTPHRGETSQETTNPIVLPSINFEKHTTEVQLQEIQFPVRCENVP